MIYEYLRINAVGAQNAKTKKELCKVFGITEHTLRLTIEKERRDGKPILSLPHSPGGYFLAESIAELERYISSMSARTASTAAAMTAARQELKRMKNENQLDIFDGGLSGQEENEV